MLMRGAAPRWAWGRRPAVLLALRSRRAVQERRRSLRRARSARHPERVRTPGVTAADFSWEAFERWRGRDARQWVVRFELVAGGRPGLGAGTPEGAGPTGEERR